MRPDGCVETLVDVLFDALFNVVSIIDDDVDMLGDAEIIVVIAAVTALCLGATKLNAFDVLMDVIVVVLTDTLADGTGIGVGVLSGVNAGGLVPIMTDL